MTNAEPDLFSDESSSANGSALQVGTPGAAKLSPVQRRFNTLLKRIDKLKREVLDFEKLAEIFLPTYHSRLNAVEVRHKAAMLRMALWLDERLARNDLLPEQRVLVVDYLCGICADLAADGDESMAAMHDKHSPQSLRELDAEEAALMRFAFEKMTGKPLHMDEEDASLEAVLRAGEAKFIEAAKAGHAAEDTVRAARTQSKKPSATQRKAEQQQENAETVLRQLYRQLASALHPDRERDPAEQQRKTALMSEANAAYAAQDIVALLHLQLRIAQVDASGLLQQPEEKLVAMTDLLKRQVLELELALWHRQHDVCDIIGMAPVFKLTPLMLHDELRMQERDLEDDVAAIEKDFRSVQTDKGFKRWLKDIAKRAAEDKIFDFGDSDFL